jgi:hypothetical protein
MEVAQAAPAKGMKSEQSYTDGAGNSGESAPEARRKLSVENAAKLLEHGFLLSVGGAKLHPRGAAP